MIRYSTLLFCLLVLSPWPASAKTHCIGYVSGGKSCVSCSATTSGGIGVYCSGCVGGSATCGYARSLKEPVKEPEKVKNVLSATDIAKLPAVEKQAIDRLKREVSDEARNSLKKLESKTHSS